MTMDFMSSEESDPENPKTRKVTDFFYDLDKTVEEFQGKHQCTVRALSGEDWSRAVPESHPGINVPSWAIVLIY